MQKQNEEENSSNVEWRKKRQDLMNDLMQDINGQEEKPGL
jgi:hypothetical protein